MNKNASKYSKSFLPLIISLILIAVLWGIFDGKVEIKELTIPFLSALSTFLGALFAFRLNENKEYLEIRNVQLSALKRSLFILARQANAVNLIDKILEPYISENERAFNLLAFKPPNYTELNQNFEDLEFLLNSEYVNLLLELTVEEERFHQALESLKLRSDFYVIEVLPLIASKSLSGKALSSEELFEALGERVFGTAITYSNSLYYHIFENKKSINSMHNKLFAVSKKFFPNEKFIRPLEIL